MKVVQATLILSAMMGFAGCVAASNGERTTRHEFPGNREAKTMYKKLTTNMMVGNVDNTVDFYKDVLGFEFFIGVPENSQEIVTELQKGRMLGFAIMKYGEIEIMFQTRKSLSSEFEEFESADIGGSITLYIEVRDVQELYEKLKDKVTVILEPKAKFYGKREFYIRDCNGYILGFAGDL